MNHSFLESVAPPIKQQGPEVADVLAVEVGFGVDFDAGDNLPAVPGPLPNFLFVDMKPMVLNYLPDFNDPIETNSCMCFFGRLLEL
ncbi:MAG: hypothetical protein ISS17_05050 [Bacteroidales bacterium]|nr:hypothetical protein [Bacteroidales bacterium]